MLGTFFTDFLSKRKKRVALNGHLSSWADIKSGVPQGSIPRSLLFFLCINDLRENLHSNPKLFAYDTSLFSTVTNEALSNSHLNDNLSKINDWAYKWKMGFNLTVQNPLMKFILYPPITFNDFPVKRVESHKHLGLTPDSKSNFHEHISSILSQVNKLTAALRKLQSDLPRHLLLAIYKAFIRPHLDYCDVIYDKILNESCHKKLESAQCNATLAITEAIRSTNIVKLYQEFGSGSLENRRKLRRLSSFYKIYKNQSALYLYNLIPGKTTGNYPL